MLQEYQFKLYTVLGVILSPVLSASSLQSSYTFILLPCRTLKRLLFETKVKLLSQY